MSVRVYWLDCREVDPESQRIWALMSERRREKLRKIPAGQGRRQSAAAELALVMAMACEQAARRRRDAHAEDCAIDRKDANGVLEASASAKQPCDAGAYAGEYEVDSRIMGAKHTRDGDRYVGEHERTQKNAKVTYEQAARPESGADATADTSARQPREVDAHAEDCAIDRKDADSVLEAYASAKQPCGAGAHAGDSGFFGENIAEPRLVPVEWHTLPGGKPVIDGGPHFCLAHAGDVAVCAVSDEPVGVDVEPAREISSGMRRKIFSAAEQHRPDGDMLWTWVAKESFIKLTGEGLRRSMVGFSASEGEIRDDSGRRLAWMQTVLLEWREYTMCVCAQRSQKVIVRRLHWSENGGDTNG